MSSLIINGQTKLGNEISISLINDDGTIISEYTSRYSVTWYGFYSTDESFDLHLTKEITEFKDKFKIKLNRLAMPVMVVKLTDNLTNSEFVSNIILIQGNFSNQTKSQTEELPIVGSGVNYDNPITTGGVTDIITNLNRINQSIDIILNTAKGTVPMLPSLGCGIHSMLFSTLTETAVEDMRLTIESALNEQEPRINLISVDPSWDYDGNSVSFTIKYSIVDTNVIGNYIYNYESNGGEVQL